MSAATFRTFCQQALDQWQVTMRLLNTIPSPTDVASKTTLYVALSKEEIEWWCSDDVFGRKKSDSKEKVPIRHDKVKRRKTIKQKCQCPDCDKKFVCAQHLSQHLMGSTDYKRCCHICATIMSRDELIRHLKEVHDQKIFDCKKCPAFFETAKLFICHMSKAHSTGAYFCGDCGCSFPSSFSFHGHLSMHIAENCPSCDKLFRNHRCYLHHIKMCCDLDKTRSDIHYTKHKALFEIKNNKTDKKVKVGIRGSADRECTCDYCGKKFAGKKFVCAHIQIVHTKNTHKPCPYCGKLLAAAHMNVHIKKHVGGTSFTCEHCNFVLKTRLGYIQHLRLHTGERPYACKYCPERFSASSRRSEHVRRKHKSAEELVLKHVCEFCPARFRLPYRLKQHVSSVHGVGDDSNKLRFECPDCYIKFNSRRGLLNHSKKHQTFSLKSTK